jgi:hypothetical protein
MPGKIAYIRYRYCERAGAELTPVKVEFCHVRDSYCCYSDEVCITLMFKDVNKGSIA